MDFLYSINFDNDFLAGKALDKNTYPSINCQTFMELLPPEDADQVLVFDSIFTRKLSSYLDSCYPFSKMNMRSYFSHETEAPFLRMASTEYYSESGKQSIKKWLYLTGIPFSTSFLVESSSFSIQLPFKIFIRHFLLIHAFMTDIRALDLQQRFLFITNHECGITFASILPHKLTDEERWEQSSKFRDQFGI